MKQPRLVHEPECFHEEPGVNVCTCEHPPSWMTPPVIGIDPGARNIGCAWPLRNDVMRSDPPQYAAHTIGDQGLRGGDRLLYLGEALGRMLDVAKPELALIEGYGFASKALATQAEAGGIIRRELAARSIHYQVVAPGALKKAVTGNGNASKERMEMAVNLGLAKAGAELTAGDDHQADALGLAWVLIEAGAWWQTPLHSRAVDLINVVRAALPDGYKP